MHKKDLSHKVHKGEHKYIDDKSGFSRYSGNARFEKNAMVDQEWYEIPFEPSKYNLVYETNYRQKYKMLRPRTNAVLVEQAGYVTWDEWEIPFGDTAKAWNTGQTNNDLIDNPNDPGEDLVAAIDTPEGY